MKIKGKKPVGYVAFMVWKEFSEELRSYDDLSSFGKRKWYLIERRLKKKLK